MIRWPERPRCGAGSAAAPSIDGGCLVRSHLSAAGRRGFTLTEVLVVAVVIGILLSLITAAGFSALTRAQEFAISTETGKLALAMEMFKKQYGSYPPADLTPPTGSQETDRLYQFVVRVFPHYIQRLALDSSTAGNTLEEKLRNDLQGTQGNGGKGIFLGDTADEFNPGHALVFWLAGFSGDAGDPFAGHRERMKGENLTAAFYDFDKDNLLKGYYDQQHNAVNDPGAQESQATLTAVYIPNKQAGGLQLGEINQTAVLYFDSTCYTSTNQRAYKGFSAYTTTDGKRINPRSFQIVNAGLDRKLGTGGPSRGGEDADNVAHFSSKLMGDRTAGDESNE